VLVLLILVVVVAGRGLGFRWDPLNLAGRRLEAAQTRAEVASADAAARRLEIEGEAGQRLALDRHHQQALAVMRVTAPALAQARSAEDALEPLDPERAGRLHAHDRRLCRISPAVCADTAAADPAGDGDDTVSTGTTG
tara:strand:+ start:27669 stop:28082 length:414 start_codon:yes stop_codon:yes gene_type:complete